MTVDLAKLKALAEEGKRYISTQEYRRSLGLPKADDTPPSSSPEALAAFVLREVAKAIETVGQSSPQIAISFELGIVAGTLVKQAAELDAAAKETAPWPDDAEVCRWCLTPDACRQSATCKEGENPREQESQDRAERSEGEGVGAVDNSQPSRAGSRESAAVRDASSPSPSLSPSTEGGEHPSVAKWFNRSVMYPENMVAVATDWAVIGTEMAHELTRLQVALQEQAQKIDRYEGRLCLVCGATTPCELSQSEMPPCTFDPNPIDAARAFLTRAEKAEQRYDRVYEVLDDGSDSELITLVYQLKERADQAASSLTLSSQRCATLEHEVANNRASALAAGNREAEAVQWLADANLALKTANQRCAELERVVEAAWLWRERGDEGALDKLTKTEGAE